MDDYDDVGQLVDGDFVAISSEDSQKIPSKQYQTISKGRVKETDSKCLYCCWNVAEILKAFVLPLFYTILLGGCCVYCWQIISNYVHSLHHPIETLSYHHTDAYEAPGIAVFLYDNALFISCEKSYVLDESEAAARKKSNVKRGRRLSSILRDDSNETIPCLFSTISSYESVMERQNTSLMVFEGPSNVMRREYMRIHFKAEPKTSVKDVGFLEFFPFASFKEWTQDFNSSEMYLQDKEKLQDTWPLAIGFITYSRLSIREFKYDIPNSKTDNKHVPPNGRRLHRTIFNPLNDIVKYLPPDAANYTPHYENMFAIFEWRDSEYEVIESVVTQNLVTTVGLMVTAILMMLRMSDLTKVILRRQRIRFLQNRLSFYDFCTCCAPEDIDG